MTHRSTTDCSGMTAPLEKRIAEIGRERDEYKERYETQSDNVAGAMDVIAEQDKYIAELERERDKMATLLRKIGLHPNMELAEKLLSRRDKLVAADAFAKAKGIAWRIAESLEESGDADDEKAAIGCDSVAEALHQEASRLRKEAEGVE